MKLNILKYILRPFWWQWEGTQSLRLAGRGAAHMASFPPEEL